MSNRVPDFEKLANEIKKDVLRHAGTEAVNFFKQSFVNQGFTDSSFKAWTKSNNPLMSKRTLYNKGVLMQSIRKSDQSENKVIVKSDVSYSEIHNEGGYITITPQMKRFFWAKYMELSGKVKTIKNGQKSKDKRYSKASKAAEFCKAMALKKVGSKIKIPQRQFIGNSQVLNSHLQKFITEKIEERFGVSINLKNGI